MNKKITMIVLSVILGICILLFGYTYIKYTNIVKLMASDGKFKENFMQIEDFDDKILLLEIYKDMFNK